MKRAIDADFGRSLLRGFGRVLDLRGATASGYPYRPAVRRSDGESIAADWGAVFGDLGDGFTLVKRRDASAPHGR